ncbi:hypothetical protein FEV09_16930 [Pseudanabaena catenata USMAC16]|uniref:Uncharacterized protein n=2 Tax=Pseudanabaena TaxID=1152 RepID=L8MU69_9CYAN|nr:hypothetical protein [Pseudanabaena catenata]ELS31512.1 hypothetical protein Pse7429DRAFT_4170 [Pseudanabaena biceps PCC 7429]MDG3496231.1 hypothetical protein [Pseudanabaena catenata USMAC16]
MPLLSWQLWLARQLVIDTPLPWQKPQTNLTFGRVAQGFAALLVRIGSPACSPNLVVSLLVGIWAQARSLSSLSYHQKRASRPKRSTKTSLIPNPKYSPFHSLGFAQFSILWVTFSCSFSD